MPVTFEQAVKEPIFIGLSLYFCNCNSSSFKSTKLSASGLSTTTSAMVSYHDV